MKSLHFGVKSSDFLVNPWINPQIVWISLNPWIYQIYLRIFNFPQFQFSISFINSVNRNYNYNSKSSVLDFKLNANAEAEAEWLNP